MNYTECLAYLEKLGDEVLTMKLGLQNIRALLEALDQPHLQFSSVVVAGTNGKGSVSHILEGLITLEDLIEEIVGEIEDESDKAKPLEYQSIDQDTIITNGDIEIDTINDIFKTKVPQGDDYASLNGLLHEKLQDIPKEGDKVEVDSLRIVVEKVSKNRPEKIRIERITR